MTENELLIELERELSLPELEPDEVTALMVAEHTGISVSQAARTLKLKHQAGLLMARQVKLPNRRVATAYRKVESC